MLYCNILFADIEIEHVYSEAPNFSCSKKPVHPSSCEKLKLSFQDKLYRLVEIGGQCWFAESLSVKGGSSVPESEPILSSTWLKIFNRKKLRKLNDLADSEKETLIPFEMVFGEKGRQCYKSINSCEGFEKSRGVCPKGWHIPSNCEFKHMIKSVTKSGIKSLLPGGATGFNWKLMGYKNYEGKYAGLGNYGELWSSSYSTNSSIMLKKQSRFYRWQIINDGRPPRVSVDDFRVEKNEYSIRCVKD